MAGEAQDHRPLLTTLSDHDIPEHGALPESAAPLSSSAVGQLTPFGLQAQALLVAGMPLDPVGPGTIPST